MQDGRDAKAACATERVAHNRRQYKKAKLGFFWGAPLGAVIRQ